MQIHLKSNQILINLYVILLLSTIISCYEPKEGCLELLASNYDVSSDDPCDDCCTYPSIRLQLKHLWNDTTFRFGDTLIDQTGNKFVLIDQKIMLSEFKYLTSLEEELEKLGKFEFTKDGEDYSLDNDFTLISKNQTSKDINKYKGTGSITQYNFKFGMSGIINEISVSQAENENDLAYSNNMRNLNEYASYWLEFARGDALSDTLNFYILEDLEFSIPTLVEINVGSTLTLPLTINYSNWFKDVDFQNDNINDINEKIKSNTTNSIY